jgi:hypothetical protein
MLGAQASPPAHEREARTFNSHFTQRYLSRDRAGGNARSPSTSPAHGQEARLGRPQDQMKTTLILYFCS